MVKPKRNFIIKSSSRILQVWDVAIALATYYNGFYIPFSIAFLNDGASHLSIIVELFYVIDIIIRMRVSRIDPDSGEEIIIPTDIAKRYMTSLQFLFDLLSVIQILVIFDIDHSLVFDLLSLFKLLSI